MAFSFGSNQQKPTGFGSGFGSTANTSSAAGTLFGGSATGFGAPAVTTPAQSSSAGTLFGGGAASTGFGGASAAPATSAFGGGAFGATSAAPAVTGFGGGAFGATSAPSTGFGATSAPATGFGVSSAPATGFGVSSAPATGFGVSSAPATGFGATSAPATGFGAPGGAFGATSAAPAATGFGTGAFGATSAAPATGFGGFGATSAAPATGFGGFGQTSAAPATSTGFGGFGATSMAAKAPATGFGATTTGFGGFGATSAAPAAASTGFGAPAATTGFGSGLSTGFGGGLTTTSAAPPLLGTATAAPSLFGMKTPQQLQQQGGAFAGFNQQQQPLGLNQQQQLQWQQQQQLQQQQQQHSVWQSIALNRAQWDPSGRLCGFRHFFYNKVPANQVHLYVMPPNVDPQEWENAQKANPDKTCMVPVLATGFEDLIKRMRQQDEQSQRHRQKIEELHDRYEVAKRKFELDSLTQLDEYRRRHVDQTQRLIRFLRMVQVLRYKGCALTDKEEQLKAHVEAMAREQLSNNPDALETKIRKLAFDVQRVRDAHNAANAANAAQWHTINEEDTTRIAAILADEQRAINHIVTLVRKDQADMEAIEARLGLQGKELTTPLAHV
ncbi:nucleoporin complex subunit 54-domain-containing protein [Gongronella butleri]|nr:nucleoporin complex subunit 54-domain-containing protein [Gongronella butleri]